MFYDKLKKLCELHGTNPSKITVELGMSKGSITNWKNGTTPSGDIVVRFAEHFKVPTDYLLIENYEITKNNENLNCHEKELLDTYNKLDSRGQHKLHTVIYEELDRIENTKNLVSKKTDIS